MVELKSSTNLSNREDWLSEAVKLLEDKFFYKKTRKLPKLSVSVGIPKGHSAAIGQCWDHKLSKDGTTNIFVCPSIDDNFVVLSTLLHELCHAVIGVRHGHGPEFGRIARSVGLEGKLTATTVSTESETGTWLLEMSDQLGIYPHKALNKRSNKDKDKAMSGSVLLISAEDENYKFRIKKDLLPLGLPTDPWGNKMQIKE